jgi:hypothetical protein
VTQSLSPKRRDRLRRAMGARVAQGQLPGIVILTAAGDEVAVDAIGQTAFGTPTVATDIATGLRKDTKT